MTSQSTGLVLSELTLDAIQAEATRAYLRHGDKSMFGVSFNDERLPILIEEVGEVARAMNDERLGKLADDNASLIRELIQVAAMAATWVEKLEGGAR